MLESISGLHDAGKVMGFFIWKKALFINWNPHSMRKTQKSTSIFLFHVLDKISETWDHGVQILV